MSNPVSEVTLDGGVHQLEDGSWSVMCVFKGVATPTDAMKLSEWLQHLVTSHLHEVCHSAVANGRMH
jgi:hypothetical protein